MAENKDENKEAAPEAAPEQQPADDVEKRKADFLSEYGELVGKHKVDFASYPVWVPDGTGGFKSIIQSTPVDIKNQPQKSPFVAQ